MDAFAARGVAAFIAFAALGTGRAFVALALGAGGAFWALLAGRQVVAIYLGAGLGIAAVARVALAIALVAFAAFTTRLAVAFVAAWVGVVTTAGAALALAFAALTGAFGAAFASACFAIAAVALATTAFTTFTTFTAAFAAWFVRGCWAGHGRSHGSGCVAKAKQALEPGEEALLLWRCRGGSRCAGARVLLALLALAWGTLLGAGALWAWLGDGRGRIGQHAFDHRGLLVGGLLRAARDLGALFYFLGQLVAGLQVFQARVVVLEAFELVVRRLHRLVGHHEHRDALLEFDFGDFVALFVEQERGHFHRHLYVYGGGVVLHRLLLDDAQDLQRRAFRVADVAGAAAARAVDVRAFRECWLEALAAHLHQAKFADGAELHAGAVLAQRVAQAVFHFAAVLRLFHVDEVDDDQAAQIAQAHLACHFIGGFQVGAGGGFFDVTALDGARRVHVNRDQRFGVVNDDGPARGQLHGAGVGRLNLVLNLKAAEQRCVVTVALDAGRVLGHHVAHELLRLLVDVIRVDQDVANVAVEVVADGADHQARFLVNQESTFARFGRAINGVPQLEQVVQVPLQLRGGAANTGRARDDAHALGVVELVHRFFQLGTVFTLNAARDATAARVVGHQHHVAASQAHEGGQRCAFVAALFFFHLHQQLLAFADHIVDARLAR